MRNEIDKKICLSTKAYTTIALCLLLFIFTSSLFKTVDVHQLINNLSKEEKEVLSCTCGEFLQYSQFGYTLFGDKPISLVTTSHSYHQSSFLISIALPLIKKHVKTLQFPNFFFRIEENSNCTLLYLINKKAFLKIVHDNKALFQDVLGKNVTPESLLYDIQHNKKSFFSICKNSHALMGICFGFGPKNSFHYEQREQIESCYKQESIPRKTQALIPSKQELLKAFEQKLQVIGRECEASLSPPLYMWIPSFVGDPKSEETKDLIKKYQSQREVLKKLLKSDRIVETIVEKLTENS